MKLWELKKCTKVDIGGVDFVFRKIDGMYGVWDNGEVGFVANTEVHCKNGQYYIDN